MKIYFKKHTLTYDHKTYSVEIFSKIEEKCNCIDRIPYRIDNNMNECVDNPEINLYLLDKNVEVDVDYDWDENPISTYYEDENLIPINFCPICGDKIEKVLEVTRDFTDEIKPLLDELKENNKKRYSLKRNHRRFEIIDEIQNIMLENRK